MTPSIQQVSFDKRIAALLKESDLPTEDLSSGSVAVLYSYNVNNDFQGIVGLELYGSCGLVRSLAVTPGCRGRGIGEALLGFAERVAAASGVAELYLLTTTANRYFSKHGYSMVDRVAAPEPIARTPQFSALCPSSSAFMVKRL